MKSNPRTDKNSISKFISKRSSVDQKFQILQSEQLFREQRSLNKKSLMLNNNVVNAYKSNEIMSISNNSQVSADIATAVGMIGA